MQAETQRHRGVDLAAIQAAAAPVLRAHGVELVEVAWKTEHGGWILRVTVELPGDTGPNGGVNLAALAEISRDLSAALDVADPVPQRYSLEVSSPGLDRPLRTPAEFRRFVGQLAKVHLDQPAADGQRVLRGRLLEAASDTVSVEVDGKQFSVPYAQVTRAHLVYEFPAQPKKELHPKAPKAPKHIKGRG